MKLAITVAALGLAFAPLTFAGDDDMKCADGQVKATFQHKTDSAKKVDVCVRAKDAKSLQAAFINNNGNWMMNGNNNIE
jgi:hypothetical protein